MRGQRDTVGNDLRESLVEKMIKNWEDLCEKILRMKNITATYH